LFEKKLRMPICAVYGFVRFADEIVDTFHDYNKEELLHRFRQDTYKAIEEKISLNPILHTFQQVVHRYNIEMDLIDAFLDSMAMDLDDYVYTTDMYKKYIYGSAEVVGLMCLRIFCDGKEEEYQSLKASASSLGAAFQKVNFLRDIKSDYEDRGRVYFPNVDYHSFSEADKKAIEADIKADFDHAYEGIVRLPRGARLGVYLAYVYYTNLTKKISRESAAKLSDKRIRVSDPRKIMLLFKSSIKHSFNIL
jgi:phytoene/squalene synthetase